MMIYRIVFFLFFGIVLAASEPTVVYLTWVDDPTATMTVLWHTSKNNTASQLYFRAENESKWKVALGNSWEVEETDVLVHRIDLVGLGEDTVYLFKIGKDEYRFRTMPTKLNRSIRFAIGGDAYYYRWIDVFQQMNQMISGHDPDFVVIGGDLAYTRGKKRSGKGREWELERWHDFFKELKLEGADGRLIPILPIVGNHEIRKKSKTEMFYELFVFPEFGKSYRAIDFGQYLSLVMLDSGHTWPIDGRQTAWLEKTLESRVDIPYLFAAYHIAAYPSYSPYMSKKAVLLRNFWSPLFEKYGVPLVFEHHNHCYKRTHPIKEGKIDPTGVIYLGDGSWGVEPRKPHENLWYMAKVASANACFIVTLTAEKCEIEAKNHKGELLDRLSFRSEEFSQYLR